jgi:hypothetical protein
VVFVLLAVVIAFTTSGHYQPNIPPPPPVPNPNALDDYTAAATLFTATGGDKTLTGPNGKPLLANEVRAVRLNQPALARLRAGLAKKCGIPFDARMEATFPYLTQCRSLARLLSAESHVNAARSEYLPAALSALDAIQIGTDIERGGSLMHALTGTAAQAIGQAALLKVIGNLRPDDCDRVMTRLDGIIRNRVPVQETLQNESRWMLKTLVDYHGGSPMQTFTAYGSGDEDEGLGHSMRQFADDMAWRFSRDKTLRELEKYMMALIAEASKPALVRKLPPEPGGYAGAMVPSYELGLAHIQSVDLRNRLLLIELAIRRYRTTHGALPNNLSVLGLTASSVTDPESGQSVIYLTRGEGYLLYGVGPDGKNDGGVPADEGTNPEHGDLGIRAFRIPQPGFPPGSSYRLVPHMLPPKLPPGAPKLLP